MTAMPRWLELSRVLPDGQTSPPPWRVERRRFYSPGDDLGDYSAWVVLDGERTVAECELESDALFLARAPEMLRMLRIVRFDCHRGWSEPLGGPLHRLVGEIDQIEERGSDAERERAAFSREWAL